MKLKEIIRGMDTVGIRGGTDIEISSITSNSREVTGDSMFVAIRGISSDGHNYIDDAVRRGAVAVIYEDERKSPDSGYVTAIEVNDTRDALAYVAGRFYDSPSGALRLIGITGTNGKTSTSYLIRDMIERWGKKTGLIGTIRYVIGEKEYNADFTTPEPVRYQKLLSEMKKEGCEYVVSEVSSHALSQKRVDYTTFERAVFTNLSRDHLDYHGTMDGYFEVKKRLFTDLLDASGVAILNADDGYASRIISDISQQVITYGLGAGADVKARDIKQDFDGMSMTLVYEGGENSIRTGLIGIPNAYNILAAVATAISLNVPMAIITEAVAQSGHVDGRFETLKTKEGVLFVIDYAHTPDALDKLLETIKGLPHREIITVFGCGGNRDRGKRPLMGQIACDKSDRVIITSDNPRYEDANAIIDDIRKGMRGRNYGAVTDRGEAIKEAVSIAAKGDIVVVAGKGHENYQEIKGVRYPMSDRELILRALKESGKA